MNGCLFFYMYMYICIAWYTVMYMYMYVLCTRIQVIQCVYVHCNSLTIWHFIFHSLEENVQCTCTLYLCTCMYTQFNDLSLIPNREGHLTVAQLLLNHNARVNVPSGSENNIPLTLACWKGLCYYNVTCTYMYGLIDVFHSFHTSITCSLTLELLISNQTMCEIVNIV